MQIRDMTTHLCSYKRKADSGSASNHDGSNLAKNQKTSTQRIMYRWGESLEAYVKRASTGGRTYLYCQRKKLGHLSLKTSHACCQLG